MKTAMILAAGRGERLKPLTDRVTKAMCLVGGIPIIEHHIRNLAKAGFTNIIINHAYLGGQIREHLGNGDKWGVNLRYSPEPPGGLETGGGIKNALSLLGTKPFLTVNADIYTDFQFNTLTLPPNSQAHLVLGKNPVFNSLGDFGLTDNHWLTKEHRPYTFLGIACYHPKAFESYLPGRYSVINIVLSLMKKNGATGEVFQGQWIDIGTLARLSEANHSASQSPTT